MRDTRIFEITSGRTKHSNANGSRPDAESAMVQSTLGLFRFQNGALMNHVKAVIVAALVASCTAALAADGVTDRAAPGPAQPMVPIPGAQVLPLTVEQRLSALQQQVQVLQTQVAALQSVLKVTSTSTTLQGPTLFLMSTSGTTIQSGAGINISSGGNLAIQSQANASLRAGAAAAFETSGQLDLKGAVVKLNGGGKPVATVGSAVANGKILTGSATILGN